MNDLAPHPGTVAAAIPEPELVTLARDLARQGVDIDAGVRALLDEDPDLAELQRAKTYWVRRQRRMSEVWDDEHPTHVLMMLEGALTRVRPMPAPRDSRTTRKRRWLTI